MIRIMGVLRRIAPRIALVLILAFPAGIVRAGDDSALVMITSSTCPWCEAFEDEVGASYHRTDEAETYPLVRVDIVDSMPERFSHINGATLTPTFIFIRDGEEIGRITGYPGSELFWWRMSEFVPGPAP